MIGSGIERERGKKEGKKETGTSPKPYIFLQHMPPRNGGDVVQARVWPQNSVAHYVWRPQENSHVFVLAPYAAIFFRLNNILFILKY